MTMQSPFLPEKSQQRGQYHPPEARLINFRQNCPVLNRSFGSEPIVNLETTISMTSSAAHDVLRRSIVSGRRGAPVVVAAQEPSVVQNEMCRPSRGETKRRWNT